MVLSSFNGTSIQMVDRAPNTGRPLIANLFSIGRGYFGPCWVEVAEVGRRSCCFAVYAEKQNDVPRVNGQGFWVGSFVIVRIRRGVAREELDAVSMAPPESEHGEAIHAR